MFYNDWLTRRERYTPHKEAVIDTGEGDRYTYSELNTKANRLAGYLQSEHHLEAGDRLVVVSRNSVEYLLLFFACAKIGVILVPLNYRLPTEVLLELIADASPKTAVYSKEFEAVGEKARSNFRDSK
ncbi:MAG TPA: class I adenylate-forming enzyme family protein, partial [Balneolaceae bacterium]|nr:class I adenylate-forming enzyme family protein [Balneolaceae bacterium]